MGYIGFWVTWIGIQPISNKLEVTVNMKPPNKTKEVRAFMGIVNYYRDMWTRRSHLLHPLTALASNKVKFKWADVEQKAFDDIKRAIAQDILLVYLYFNKSFDTHTEASNYQLGAVISQNGKPIDFCSCKLTGLKTRYTVTEKEFLRMFETLN